MGADLWIEKTGRYFRDSCNPTNVWWILGMSYWEEQRYLEHNKWLEDGIVKPEGVKYIHGKLQERELSDELIKQHIAKNARYMEDPDNYDKWSGYFRKKHAEMMEFWEEADREGSGVLFNV